MMLWRWDRAARDWQSDLLRPGTVLPLGKDALLFFSGPHARCTLVTRQGVARVNGLPALPLRILADRDAIEVEGETVYFTLDAPPEVLAFTAQTQAVGCARCKGTLKEGEQAVQCPRCKSWHHQSEGLPCWAYHTHCAQCPQPTTGVAWTPEPLDREHPAAVAAMGGNTGPER